MTFPTRSCVEIKLYEQNPIQSERILLWGESSKTRNRFVWTRFNALVMTQPEKFVTFPDRASDRRADRTRRLDHAGQFIGRSGANGILVEKCLPSAM